MSTKQKILETLLKMLSFVGR